MQVAGIGAEAAHAGGQARGGVLAPGRYPIGGDADQVHVGRHVDAGRMGVLDGQRLRFLTGRSWRPLRGRLGPGGLLLGCVGGGGGALALAQGVGSLGCGVGRGEPARAKRGTGVAQSPRRDQASITTAAIHQGQGCRLSGQAELRARCTRFLTATDPRRLPQDTSGASRQKGARPVPFTGRRGPRAAQWLICPRILLLTPNSFPIENHPGPFSRPPFHWTWSPDVC
jgi:hypothetical protein